jgi:tRNA(fMet)-specific endonuclease VapC
MMPGFMLDTDTVSFALRGQGQVGSRLLEHRPSEICISSITLGELRYGAARRRSRKLNRLIDTFTGDVSVLAFDRAAGDRFGSIAASLASGGTPIGGFDTLIAAHALAADLTLVTNNTKHFARVDGLRTDNWS